MTSSVEYDKILCKFGQQQLVLVNYTLKSFLLSSFTITEKLHTFSFDCKLLVHENVHLIRKREDVLLTQTLLSFERKL